MADTSHALEGTVTVFSTDLVGSTRLNQQLGDEAASAIERAREVQLAMAQRNRRDGNSVALELRIGLHTGEVIEKSDSLGGETLIIAKRIESVAPRARSSCRRRCAPCSEQRARSSWTGASSS